MLELDLEGLLTISPSPPSSPLSSLSSGPASQGASSLEDNRRAIYLRQPNEDPTTPPSLARRLPSHVPPLQTVRTQPTENAGPPDSDTVFSSPIVARNGRTIKQVRQAKAQKKRKHTMAANKATREAAREESLRASVHANETARAQAALEAAQCQSRCFQDILKELARQGHTWGDFVEWVSRPSSDCKTERFEGLFRNHEQVVRILDLWAWKNSRTGKKAMRSWAVGYLGKVVSKEGQSVTRSGVLVSRRLPMTASSVLNFNLADVYQRVCTMCPTMTQLVQEYSTSPRQKRIDRKRSTAKEQAAMGRREERKCRRIGAALTQLLGERSQANSLTKHILGLYLYATGAQRQLISVLCTMGVSSSYPSIAGSARPEDILTAESQSKSRLHKGSKANKEDVPTDSEEDPDYLPQIDTDSETDSDSDDEDTDIEEHTECMLTGTTDEGPEARPQKSRKQKEPEKTVEAPTNTPETLFSRVLARGAGLLRRLSLSCRLSATRCARESLCGYVYDNINMIFKVAEQILGRKDAQENGTCATTFPLFDARPEDMKTADLLQSIDTAPPLAVKDILHTPDEAALFQQSLEHAILRVIVSSSHLFARFSSEVDNCLPGTDDQIPLHQTDIHPLPAMNIDESSTTGNGEVMDAIFKELGFNVGSTAFSGTVRPIFGDQLSISRLRTLIANRAGHDTLANSYAYAVFGPGFFHHQMALTHGIIETHWGDPCAGARNPACLSFFNTIVDRKPIVLSSLPPYRTCRDLIFTSLSACVLRCLQQIVGKPLEQYSADVTFSQLREHAAQLFKTYGNPLVVSALRRERYKEEALRGPPSTTANSSEPSSETFNVPVEEPLTQGDMVYENATLFLRDALILREFADAIKGGYSGRIIRVLKTLALMYRGCGRTKYAHELLHLIHNLEHVWPKPLRDIMIKNWLVNPTGKANSWVPVDLLQEHLNFWIKVIYKAQGSNASWEWLTTISPCIVVLRQLATQMNASLGSQQGNKHHSPSLDRDLATLQDALKANDVFAIQPGRVLRGVKNGEVPNVITAGLNQLCGPLADYNKVFQQLQKRRREPPLEDTGLSVGHAESAGAEQPPVALAVHSDAIYTSATAPVVESANDIVDEVEIDDDEDEYWRELNEDTYEPREVFAQEEDVSLELDDF